jgi:hypothetical protein
VAPGDYSIRPATVKKHVAHADPVSTALNASDLPAASTGYTAVLEKTHGKKVYRLEELVGEGSKFGFELRQWDGK